MAGQIIVCTYDSATQRDEVLIHHAGKPAQHYTRSQTSDSIYMKRQIHGYQKQISGCLELEE
jgi:hypothetical protein